MERTTFCRGTTAQKDTMIYLDGKRLACAGKVWERWKWGYPRSPEMSEEQAGAQRSCRSRGGTGLACERGIEPAQTCRAGWALQLLRSGNSDTGERELQVMSSTADDPVLFFKCEGQLPKLTVNTFKLGYKCKSHDHP